MQNNNDYLIAILMPAFNAVAHLSKSVQSVLDQSYKEFELIIVDDGSTDGSLEIAKQLETEDERIKVFSKCNAGWPAARNFGLRHSKGSLIALLDADDTWHPTLLEKLHNALINQPESKLAYCGWQNLGVSENRGKPYIPPDYEGPEKALHLLQGCPWPIHATLTRRYLIEEAGGFNENLTSTADYDLWLKIATANKLVRVPEVLAYYHHHNNGQITSNRALIAINQNKIQRNFLSNNPHIRDHIGIHRIKAFLSKQLLNRGFECYWERDMTAAREIFQHAMRSGYGTPKEWLYMLPALLPLSLHKTILKKVANDKASKDSR